MDGPATADFLQHGRGIFTPTDNLELPRAGQAVVNDAEDLFFVSLSQLSFHELYVPFAVSFYRHCSLICAHYQDPPPRRGA